MHDFLEGIIPAILILVFKQLLREKLIQLAQLNYIQHFPYGVNHRASKPPPIPEHALRPSGEVTDILRSYRCCLVGEENSARMTLWSLLVVWTSEDTEGTFVVNVTQTSYQAEENANITLEWMFTTKTDSSSDSLSIFCQMLTDHKSSVLFHLHEGVESPESQDEQFAGRVQCDKDVLREGRIRLQVSRLRTDDSGLYLCDVLTNYGANSGRCRLSVTAAADEPKPQRPTVSPQPESWGRIGLYVLLTAALLTVCAGLCFAFRRCSNKSTDKKRNVYKAVSTFSKRMK